MEKKNIVITGGLGYVGGRLSKYFADLGHHVYALSRSKKVDYPNITILKNKDVLDFNALDNIKVDVLIHLAATNEITCTNEPQKSNEVNINGTLDWLEWSSKNKVSQFIYFSTVHVYARPLIGSFSESSICRPNHPYSISHKSAEDYVHWYRSDFGLNTTIVRLSNSFGYPAFPTADRWTLFVNDICHQIIKSRSFELRSNVLQHRDFISISEVCEGVQHLLEVKNLSINTIEDTIYNLSMGKSTSLLDFAKLIKNIAEEYLGESIELIYDESKSELIDETHISNQKLVNLGWAPSKVHHQEEIKLTLDYFSQYA